MIGLGSDKNNKKDQGFKGMNQLHLLFMLRRLFLNSEYADIVHFLKIAVVIT